MRINPMLFLLFISSFLFLRSIPHAWSASDSETPEAYTLGEVVIKGQKAAVEAAGTVREITAQDIQDKDARNLKEALELLPGVDMKTGGDGVSRINIRGFRPRQVTLLLDGVPLNSTYDGQFDPSIIPTENIARIKVSYGTSSVLYGQGGLGGVINIITRKGEKGIHGMASGETGDGSSRLGRFHVGGANENLDFFVSGSMAARNDYPLSDNFQPTSLQNDGQRNNSDNRRNNLFGNIGYSPTKDWHMGLIASYVSGNYGIPSSTRESTKKNPDSFANNPKYERVNHFEGFNTQFSTDYDLPGPVDVRGWVYVNRFDEERTRYDNDHYNSMLTKNTYFEDGKSTILGGTVQPSINLKSAGLITLGLDAQRQEYEAKGKIRDVKVGKSHEFRPVDETWNASVYSASIEYEVSLLRDLGVVLGYGHYWQQKNEGQNDHQGGYLAGIYYDMFKDTRLKSSFAKKIRFPSLRQLYGIGEGNPDLTTEKSYNYELGIEQQLPLDSRVTLTGFLSDVNNFIEKPSGEDYFQNYDKYRFQGLEINAETRFMKNLVLRLGYTFLDTRDESPGTNKDELQYRPRNKLTLEGKYTFFFDFSAYLNIIYVADQVYYSKTTPLKKRDLDNYAVVNLKFDQKLLDNFLDVYLGADNLFDKNYEEGYGFPAPGRVVYGGVALYF